jgi:hypothetical protein
MKNKSLLIVSLLLIAFLIGSSYAPSGAPQTVMAQESDPYEGMMDIPEAEVKGTLTIGTKEEIEEMYQQQNPASASEERYPIPGFAFKRGADKSADDAGSLRQDWLEHGRAYYNNADVETWVGIYHPVFIPEGSMINSLDICGSIRYSVEPHYVMKVSLFRFHWNSEELELIGAAWLNEDTTDVGTKCAFFVLDEPHYFDPYNWNYQLVVGLSASYYNKNLYELSQVAIYYEPPATNLYPLAFPGVMKP